LCCQADVSNQKANILAAYNALADRGIDPSDAVHKQGMAAAAQALGALGSNLYLTAHADPTVKDMYFQNNMSSDALHSAGIRDMMNQYTRGGTGLANLQLPMPNFGSASKKDSKRWGG
jgi:hypothetical protein